MPQATSLTGVSAGEGGCSQRLSFKGSEMPLAPATDSDQGDEQHERHMSVWLRSSCLRLGMNTAAVDMWARLHVQSELAMIVYLVAEATILCMYVYMLYGAGGSGALVYYFRVPMAVSLGSHALLFCYCCRSDTSRDRKSAVCKAVLLICVLSFDFFVMLAYLCPIDLVPFGSSLRSHSFSLCWHCAYTCN